VDLLEPLLMEIREIIPTLTSGSARDHGEIFVAGAAVLVLAGGFPLRYIFFCAGQISAFR